MGNVPTVIIYHSMANGSEAWGHSHYNLCFASIEPDLELDHFLASPPTGNGQQEAQTVKHHFCPHSCCLHFVSLEKSMLQPVFCASLINITK